MGQAAAIMKANDMPSVKAPISPRINNIYVLTVLVFIYKFALDYIYLNYITEIYSSIGFVYDFNKSRYIMTTLIIFVSVFPLKKMFDQFQKPSAIMMICFYLLYFYPNCILNSISNLDIGFFIFSLSYWLVLTLLFFYMPKIKILPKMNASSYNLTYFYILLFSVIITAITFVIFYHGFTIKYDLSDVYSIREEVKYMDVSSLFGYIKPLASHFSQIGLMFFLINKKKLLALSMIFCQLMLFAFGAHKTDFFFVIITILIFIFYRDRLKYLLLYGLILVNAVTIIILDDTSALIAVTSIYTRVLFTPNILSSYFYDFFSTHDLLYLRDHFNRLIGLDNPYGIETPYLIAILFRNAHNMQANTGLIGSDFAQFGWATLFILVPIRIMLMRLMDNVSRGLDIRIIIVASFSYAFIFANGSLLGVLLSGGFIMVCFLLHLVPRSRSESLTNDFHPFERTIKKQLQIRLPKCQIKSAI